MLVQPTEDEGEGSERPSEPQPIPSPPHPSTDQHETQTNPSPRPSPTSHITDSIPEGSGGNHGGQSSSDRSLSGNEGGMTLQSVYDLCISSCTQSVSIREESPKSEPSVHKDPAFDELDDDEIDYMETEDAQDVGRTRYAVHEEKESVEKEEGTNKQKVSTNKEEVSTDRPNEGTIDQNEGRSATQTSPTKTTPTIFGDDETIAQVLIIMSLLQPVLLTLKPLPKIDPKDKGKKKIKEDESDTESEDINETEKKFKMLAHDEEVARGLGSRSRRKRFSEEKATNAALIQDFDDIKARIEADRLLALRLQEEERAVHYGRKSKIPS
ncbi:hypothetical protein Tco_0115970 [Tanacetum coccineum]